MFNTIVSLFTALQFMLTSAFTPQGQLQLMFRSGVMLRLHVVAQDDTEAMQQLKLQVRDAVRTCYAVNCPDPDATMLENTRILLPLLTQAAEDCARAHGFEGDVRVELGTFTFPELQLAENAVPAGDYPALMIFLGDAQGHNWWGLIDPDTARWFARTLSVSTGQQKTSWDWSWRGFLSALWGRSPVEEASDAAKP